MNQNGTNKPKMVFVCYQLFQKHKINSLLIFNEFEHYNNIDVNRNKIKSINNII